MKKMIPIGIDDYRELVTRDYYYVDKTLFIKDILENGSKVMLFTRPRRFGKSLNLSMLKYFFSIDGSGQGLFDDCALARSDNPHVDEQGKYPVISISLKEMRQKDKDEAFRQFCVAVKNGFMAFRYLLQSTVLAEEDKDLIRNIIAGKVSPYECASSFRTLTRMLYEYHGQNTVILIDEYDVPS